MVAINTVALRGRQQAQGAFTESATAETAGEEAEALALTVGDMTNPTDLIYGATATDNATDFHSDEGVATPAELTR